RDIAAIGRKAFRAVDHHDHAVLGSISREVTCKTCVVGLRVAPVDDLLRSAGLTSDAVVVISDVSCRPSYDHPFEQLLELLHRLFRGESLAQNLRFKRFNRSISSSYRFHKNRLHHHTVISHRIVKGERVYWVELGFVADGDPGK